VSNNMPMTVNSGTTLLGSFNNVGTGTGTVRGSSVDASNPFAGYYYNPLSQGLVNPSPSFGSPIFTSSSGTMNSILGGNNRGSSFGTFGGTSTSSRGTAGGLANTVNGAARIGGATGTIRTSTSGSTTNNGLSYPGGSYGPTIGRTGPVVAASAHFAGRPIVTGVRRDDLQGILLRSTRLTTPAGISVTMDGNTVVLSGTVASEDERRLAENMLRLAPGVRDLRNELQAPATGP
jgi:hypothetical protein